MGIIGARWLIQLQHPAHQSILNTIDIKLNKAFKSQNYFNSIQILVGYITAEVTSQLLWRHPCHIVGVKFYENYMY